MDESPMDKVMEMIRKSSENNPPLTKEMEMVLKRLQVLVNNPVVEAAFNEAIAHVYPQLPTGQQNPWKYMTVAYFVEYFRHWFTYLGGPSGGLGFIMPFTWFYLNNRSAYYFLNEFRSMTTPNRTYTKEIFNWQVEFIRVRGEFMDSPASLAKMDDWLMDPRLCQYIEPEGGYKSFNDFFTRELDMSKDPRPINEPDNDQVVTASADTIVNWILADLTLNTPLNIKGRHINVKNLLGRSTLASKFEGGTAVSCVLMPDVYHHYHSPVTGEIVEGRDIPGVYNGIVDGEHWFNDVFNIGESDTDFSIFEDFHRAYYIFKTAYGYAALVPVGLNTISKMTPTLIANQSTMVEPGAPPVPVKKGDKLGNFSYGGSLNILLFQKGMFSSVSVLMGQRLGLLNPPASEDEE